MDTIKCHSCEEEIEITDTTYSNIKTNRCNVGDHTGNIYFCKKCDCNYLETENGSQIFANLSK